MDSFLLSLHLSLTHVLQAFVPDSPPELTLSIPILIAGQLFCNFGGVQSSHHAPGNPGRSRVRVFGGALTRGWCDRQ